MSSGKPVDDRKTAAWLTAGHHICPSWCDEFHATDDAYEDRVHQGRTVAVTLTADDHPGEDPGHPLPGAEGLLHLNMHLVQHYREERPRIWVGKGGSRQGFYLTDAEAEWLATELHDLVHDETESRRTLPERERLAEQ